MCTIFKVLCLVVLQLCPRLFFFPPCDVTICIFKCRKFEEIYPPEVAEFVYITDDTYTKKQVLRMEHLVLKVLSFDLAAPTINQFLTHYFLQHSVNKQVESLAMVSLLQMLQASFIYLAIWMQQKLFIANSTMIPSLFPG